MSKILAVLAVSICLPLEGWAAHEAIHADEWCRGANGSGEDLMDDGTKVDCVTETHAVEIQHAADWGKVIGSLGQAIHYAQQANRRPGIVLIVEDKKDCRYLRRLKKTLDGVVVHGNPVELFPPIGPNASECE